MKSLFAFFFCYWTHLKASNLLTTKNIRAVRAVVNIAALMLNYLNFSSSRWKTLLLSLKRALLKRMA